jgi:ABC-type lipoprotein release transport system permease subunit
MAIGRLWTIGFRDLLRNKRRTLLSLVAVALGLALLMVMNGLVAGMLEDTLQNTIRLQTGHVQLRSESYDKEKLTLAWQDLLEEPAALAARLAALPGVQSASPLNWAAGVLNTGKESASLQVEGIEPDAAFYDPIRSSVVSGSWLEPDDRAGVLIGARLADSIGVRAGDRVSLAVIDSEGNPVKADYEIRGLFATGIPTYDQSTVLMPLAKAQAVTNTGGRASAVIALLDNRQDAAGVAAELRAPGVSAQTWEDLNGVFLQTLRAGMNFYVLLDLIVILIVAVIIANTLLMSVFERMREMGILSSLGMKGRQIMLMFILEAAILGLAGIAVGVVLGSLGVAALARKGIDIGEAASAAGGLALGSSMRAQFDPVTFAWLAAGTFVIILLASLYPAWIAAHREPVEALRAL